MTHDAGSATDTTDDASASRLAAADPICQLTATQEAFADVLAQCDPEAPVASCPPWRVADLALHLAGIHWWASAMALGVDLKGADRTAPREPERLVEIYAWAAAHLRATLVERPLDAPALTLDGPGTASFWYRRQLHESLVHLVDLSLAAGWSLADTCAGTPSAVWADTVDEVVTVMHPRQVRLGRATAPRVAVDLVTTDVHGPSRAIVIAPPRESWRVGPQGVAADARVEGPAWALALLLWGRVALHHEALTVTGEPAAVQAVLGRTLVP